MKYLLVALLIGLVLLTSCAEQTAKRQSAEAIAKLGTWDNVGIDAALAILPEGASYAKRNEVVAKDWTYDVTSLRRDINEATYRLDPDLRTEANGFPAIVEYYWDTDAGRKLYDWFSERQQAKYVKENPYFIVGQLFWGYRVSLQPTEEWPVSIMTALELERLAGQYNVPLNLIPAFGKTESGKDRMPPKNLWQDYFSYYTIWLGDEETDSADALRFRRSHPEFEAWGEANLGWKPVTSQPSYQEQMRELGELLR